MKWTGFNFLWLYSWRPGAEIPSPDLKALDFLQKHGFNFARLACDYRFWTTDWDYFHPNPEVLEAIAGYQRACQERSIHLSLNMHRVPGYCINRPDIERDNLWTDQVAQDGFAFQWEEFARLFKGVPPEHLSFDLVNEPPKIGQLGMTRDVHKKIITRVVNAIRAVDSERAIVIDGLDGGNTAMPELAELGVIQSGRGYQPESVSHQGANWTESWKGHEPVYPGGDWRGHEWNREQLDLIYQPWKDLAAQGVKVHIGEFGCFNQTPNDVALRWLTDLTSLWREYGWGWALWNFEGTFGIIGHNRPGANLVEMDGYRVDVDLLNLIKP